MQPPRGGRDAGADRLTDNQKEHNLPEAAERATGDESACQSATERREGTDSPLICHHGDERQPRVDRSGQVSGRGWRGDTTPVAMPGSSPGG